MPRLRAAASCVRGNCPPTGAHVTTPADAVKRPVQRVDNKGVTVQRNTVAFKLRSLDAALQRVHDTALLGLGHVREQGHGQRPPRVVLGYRKDALASDANARVRWSGG